MVGMLRFDATAGRLVPRTRPAALAYPVLLFGASALTAVWQHTRAKALFDLSYILEHALRISQGEIPYRDFVIPHPPLSFLVQAAVMHLSGPGLFWHAAYGALVAGMTAVLTFRIIRSQFGGPTDPDASFRAFVLAAPIVLLNGYCVFPQPFYDVDCTFAVLLALDALLQARLPGATSWRAVAAGALLVVPLFVKQNVGAAALVSVHGVLFASALLPATDSERRTYTLTLVGSLLGLAAAAIAIQHWIGIAEYWRWTVSYAAARRWPSTSTMMTMYGQPRMWVTAACGLAACVLVRRVGRSRAWLLGSLATLALPLVEAAKTMLKWGLAARGYSLWGLGTITGSAVAMIDLVRAPRRFERAMPLVAAIVVNSAFASQGVHDSSYGMWPFLMLGLAPIAAVFFDAAAARDRRILTTCLVLASALFGLVGVRHLARNERLGFVDLSGQLERATLPSLAGLATPGTYVSDFERLVRRCETLIPREAAVVVVPGEDPFFLASRRRQRFPVGLFDDTVTPYSAGELVRLLADRRIEWVVVKERLQLRHSPWRPLATFVGRDLAPDYDVVERLPRYVILRRRAAGGGTRGPEAHDRVVEPARR
jgi:hypothetical protein